MLRSSLAEMTAVAPECARVRKRLRHKVPFRDVWTFAGGCRNESAAMTMGRSSLEGAPLADSAAAERVSRSVLRTHHSWASRGTAPSC